MVFTIQARYFLDFADFFTEYDCHLLGDVEEFLNRKNLEKYFAGGIAEMIDANNTSKEYNSIDIIGVGDEFDAYFAIQNINTLPFKANRNKLLESLHYKNAATAFSLEETVTPISIAIITEDKFNAYMKGL